MTDIFDVISSFFGMKDEDSPDKEHAVSKKERCVYWKTVDRWGHQSKGSDGKWAPCEYCGDLIGIPKESSGGGYKSVEDIQKACSKFGKY